MNMENHIFKTPAGNFYCRWSDSAELYGAYLAALHNVEAFQAKTLEIESFLMENVRHMSLGGREIVRGTIKGTIPITVQFNVWFDHQLNRWKVGSETFYVVNDQTIPSPFTAGMLELVADAIEGLEKSGELSTIPDPDAAHDAYQQQLEDERTGN